MFKNSIQRKKREDNATLFGLLKCVKNKDRNILLRNLHHSLNCIFALILLRMELGIIDRFDSKRDEQNVPLLFTAIIIADYVNICGYISFLLDIQIKFHTITESVLFNTYVDTN